MTKNKIQDFLHTKYGLLSLSLVSGIFFSVSWPVHGITWLIFFAFVPLLYIENVIAGHPEKYSKFGVFFYSYPAFLLWNVATTYWVWYSTPAAIAAWVLNAMFMSFIFSLFSYTRRRFYMPDQAYFILPVFWLAFEYVHLNWKLTWPWLTLGNVFAIRTSWIQWYEYTGFLGGSLWVMIVNIVLYKLLKNSLFTYSLRRSVLLNLLILAGAVIAPLWISSHLYHREIPSTSSLEVIACQPNLDPYSEQYTTRPEEVVKGILAQVDSLQDGHPLLAMAPESVIQEQIQESRIRYAQSLNSLQAYAKKHRNVSFLVGASTYRQYDPKEEAIPSTARHQLTYDIYYDVFNTAFAVERDRIQYHHKSKLTPGVEYMPTSGIFKILSRYAIDLGGTVGSLGIDYDIHPLLIKDSLKIAPVICYESVFGEYVASFVRQGAGLICIITNDGWWGDSPGYKQHFAYARLRAIENRKWVARSGNTGISGFINERGEVIRKTAYWVRTAVKQTVKINHQITFFARWGNYPGRVAAFMSVLLLLVNIAGILRKKRL